MKTIKIILLSLAIIISLNGVIYGQELKSKDRREFKDRCKLMKKQGYEPDAAYGTCEDQNKELLLLQNENKERQKAGKDDRWIIETVDFSSTDLGIAQDKARDFARLTLAKNLSSQISGKIEHGQSYTTETGEDIKPELKDAIGALNEVFAKELAKNKIIQRFQKREKNKWTIKVTIALDYDGFIRDVEKLSKKELRDRIDQIRKDIEKK